MTDFTEQARQLVVEWIQGAVSPVSRIATSEYNALIDRIASFAAEAATQGQLAGIEQALKYLARVRNEAATAALEQAAQWQPMSTAPKDGTRILVDFGRIGTHAVAWQQGVSGITGWCVDDLKFGPYPLRRYVLEDLKGWMPLPPSPDAATGDDKGVTELSAESKSP